MRKLCCEIAWGIFYAAAVGDVKIFLVDNHSNPCSACKARVNCEQPQPA